MSRIHLDATLANGIPQSACGMVAVPVSTTPGEITCRLCRRKMAQAEVARLETKRAESTPIGDRSFAEATVRPLAQEGLTRAEAALWKHGLEQLAMAIQGESHLPRPRLHREERWASVEHAMAELVMVRLDGYPVTSVNDPQRLEALTGALGRSYGPPGPDHRSRLAEDMAQLWGAFRVAYDGPWDGGVFSERECQVMFLARYAGRAKIADITAWLNEERTDRLGPKVASRITRFGFDRVYEHLRSRGLIPRLEQRRQAGRGGDMVVNMGEQNDNGRAPSDLFGWDEITEALPRKPHRTTAIRWAKEMDMPVRTFRGRVEANRAELHAWYHSRVNAA